MTDWVGAGAPSQAALIAVDRSSAGAVGGLGCVSNLRLVACTGGADPTQKSNLSVYDADGNKVWNDGGLLDATAWFSAALISDAGHVIAADRNRILRVDPVAGTILWQSLKPDDGAPISPVLVGGAADMVLLATKADAGAGSPELSVWDVATGALLSHVAITDPTTGIRYHTINTPAVRGNRAYVIAAGVGAPKDARLYAVDVCESAACGGRGALQVAWHHPIDGPSSASPVLLGNSLFFDGLRSRSKGLYYRIDDLGTAPSQVWRRQFSGRFGASAAADPRGGLWIAPWQSGTLLRIAERDGTVLQTVDIGAVLGLASGFYVNTAVSVSSSSSGNVVLTFGTQGPQADLGSYLAAIDVQASASGQAHWTYKVSRNALRQAVTGQYPVVVNEAGARRVVFRGTTSSTYFIGEP